MDRTTVLIVVGVLGFLYLTRKKQTVTAASNSQAMASGQIQPSGTLAAQTAAVSNIIDSAGTAVSGWLDSLSQ